MSKKFPGQLQVQSVPNLTTRPHRSTQAYIGATEQPDQDLGRKETESHRRRFYCYNGLDQTVGAILRINFASL